MHTPLLSASGASEDDTRKAVAGAYAGKQTEGTEANHNMGMVYKPSKNILPMHHAQTAGLVAHSDPGAAAAVPVKAGLGGLAGRRSTELAAHVGVPLAQVADTRCAIARMIATLDCLLRAVQ